VSDEEPAPQEQNPQSPVVDARFTPTGDVRVDEVIAQLPDPQVHRAHGGAVGAPVPGIADDQGQPLGGGLPDPGLLDEHLAAATAVHRRLQQRLSDLSG